MTSDLKMIELYVLFSLDLLNLAVYLPVFSAFSRSLGGTLSTINFIDSSCAFVCLLWNPIVGSLSDQTGRKGLLIKCLTVSAIGSVIMAASPTLLVVFIGRLFGAFGGSVGILLRSIVGDIYKSPDEKKVFFSKSAPFNSLAFLVGSLSSGFLSEAQHGYRLAFLLMACIMMTAGILAHGFLPNDTKSKQLSSKNKDAQTLFKSSLDELKAAAANIKSISWPRYKHIFIIKAGYDFATAVIMANIGLILLNEYSIQGRYLGYTFLLISVISIVANILQLKLKSYFDSASEYDILIKGGFIIIACFTGMSIASMVYVFMFFLAVMFMIKAFVDTILVQIITTQTNEDDRGKVIGVFENLMHLAGFLAPLISGLLAEIYGQRILLLSATVPLVIAVIAANRQKSKIK